MNTSYSRLYCKAAYAILLPAIVALISCSKNLALMPQDYRGGRMERLDTLHKESPDSSGWGPGLSVFVSAVISPDGYDWRQDSTFGATGSRLALFRNGEEILSLDTGPEFLVGTDPDSHHIIDGHLYSEYSTDAETVIKKDGVELFRYNGRECIKGIVPSDNGLYTLGQSRDGFGLSLRYNGKPLFAKDYGTVFGGFGQCNYDRSGALYYSYGDICFDYVFDNKKHHVRNGVEKRENEGICSHRIDFLHDDTFWYHVYPKGTGAEVGYLDDGTFFLPSGIPEGSYYFFPTEGGCYFEDVLYLALTPRKSGSKPFIWANGICTEMDINGFLSGIDVISSAPR